jgi:hypothetical protein
MRGIAVRDLSTPGSRGTVKTGGDVSAGAAQKERKGWNDCVPAVSPEEFINGGIVITSWVPEPPEARSLATRSLESRSVLKGSPFI